MASLYETVGRLHDPRVRKRSKHLISDIVILAVLAVTSGAESYDAIEKFGKYHHETLKKRLSLPNGIPSHDTINRVFQMINFRQFDWIFLEWADWLKPEGSTETVIAIEGKTVRGSRDGYHDNKTNICHLMEAHWDRVGEEIVFTIKSNRFLRNMVRSVTGTLLDVGRGKLSIDGLRTIIEKKNRCAAGVSMPAQGLFLTKVEYDWTA